MRKLLSALLLVLATPAFGQNVQTLSSLYPQGAIPVTAGSSSADTASNALTIPANPGKTSFVCGFSVSGLGSTAGGTVVVTLATLVGSVTLSTNYIYTASATTANTPIGTTYSPCLPASAAGAAITLTVPGSAGNTSTNIALWGYQQ